MKVKGEVRRNMERGETNTGVYQQVLWTKAWSQREKGGRQSCGVLSFSFLYLRLMDDDDD